MAKQTSNFDVWSINSPESIAQLLRVGLVVPEVVYAGHIFTVEVKVRLAEEFGQYGDDLTKIIKLFYKAGIFSSIDHGEETRKTSGMGGHTFVDVVQKESESMKHEEGKSSLCLLLIYNEHLNIFGGEPSVISGTLKAPPVPYNKYDVTARVRTGPSVTYAGSPWNPPYIDTKTIEVIKGPVP